MCLQVKGLNLKPRMGHSATVLTISHRITEVVIFGGSQEFLINSMVSDTTVLRFGESTLRCKCVCMTEV